MLMSRHINGFSQQKSEEKKRATNQQTRC